MKIKAMKTEIITLIAGAFGFIAALVWKDAIMAWLQPIMSSQGSGAIALTIVALLVTVLAVLAIYLMKKYL